MKHKELLLTYLSEFTARFCTWALLSQLLVHLIAEHWGNMPQILYIVGASLSLLYLSAIIGGVVKDWLFTEKQIVLLGIVLIAVSNLVLILNPSTFYIGLGIIFLGAGLVTPNTPLLLSNILNSAHLDRNKAFTFFYGITNSGVILGPILGGFVNQYYSWRGMLILNELIIMLWLILVVWGSWFTALLQIKILDFVKFFVLVLVCIATVSFYLKFESFSLYVLIVTGITYMIFLTWVAFNNSDSRKSILFSTLLIVFAIIFFTGEFQVASTMTAYASSFVNLNLFKIQIPAGSLLSIESIFVIVGAFVLTRVKWFSKLSQVSTKVSIGLLCGAAAFLILYCSTLIASHHTISLLWLVLAFLLFGFGEINLMPPIISYIAQHAPLKYKGRLMAGTYFALCLSGYLSGLIGSILMRNIHSSIGNITFYKTTFGMMALILVISASFTIAVRFISLIVSPRKMLL
jgi:POT family proton-dependent oligopeptide transporter